MAVAIVTLMSSGCAAWPGTRCVMEAFGPLDRADAERRSRRIPAWQAPHIVTLNGTDVFDQLFGPEEAAAACDRETADRELAGDLRKLSAAIRNTGIPGHPAVAQAAAILGRAASRLDPEEATGE